MPSKYAGSAANAALVLIGVAVALLDRQIAAQAAAFGRQKVASPNDFIESAKAGDGTDGIDLQRACDGLLAMEHNPG